MGHEEVDAALADLDWERQGDVLVKVVRRDDFAGALALVNAVGELAEAADHHPDIDIRWNTVTLRLTTHSAGGLTAKDLALAAGIDGLLEQGVA
jgi:4a-hydroxytetrahydrobiopterin dehydratase